MAKLPFALQLDSIREPLQEDLAGALQRVKRAGYDHVEVAGFCGLAAADFAAVLAREGLVPISSHVSWAACEHDLDTVIGECQVLGVSHAALKHFDSAAEEISNWESVGQSMAAFGEAFRKAGIVLSYHTRTAEFGTVNGRAGIDMLLDAASPDFLAIQLDAGWAQYAGADPVAVMKACAGRVPTVHIHDIKARVEGELPVPTELGNGVTRLAQVFKAARETGVQWLIVEQESSARDPLESARMNAAYMRVHVY